jgi:hypothetical protein
MYPITAPNRQFDFLFCLVQEQLQYRNRSGAALRLFSIPVQEPKSSGVLIQPTEQVAVGSALRFDQSRERRRAPTALLDRHSREVVRLGDADARLSIPGALRVALARSWAIIRTIALALASTIAQETSVTPAPRPGPLAMLVNGKHQRAPMQPTISC